MQDYDKKKWEQPGGGAGENEGNTVSLTNTNISLLTLIQNLLAHSLMTQIQLIPLSLKLISLIINNL